MFVFLIWYDLEKYFFSISFSYCVIHTRDMSMKYLLVVFIWREVAGRRKYNRKLCSRDSLLSKKIEVK